jgi:hypothetical protein
MNITDYTDEQLREELARRERVREQEDAAARAACKASYGCDAWFTCGDDSKENWRLVAAAVRAVPPSDEVVQRMVDAACIAGHGRSVQFHDRVVEHYRRIVLAALKEFK